METAGTRPRGLWTTLLKGLNKKRGREMGSMKGDLGLKERLELNTYF